MKKVFKQSLICILSVMLSVTMFPVYAFAEGGADPADTAEVMEAEFPDEFYSEEEPLDNDELFTLYAESVLYGDAENEAPLLRGRNIVPEGLNGIIYSKLKEEVALVADGTNNSTAFELSLADLGLAGKTWTAKDLGVDAIVANGAISQEAVRALQASLGVDLNVIMGALLADCPYELYWYDKTVGVTMSGPRIGASYSGSEYVMTLNSGYIFSLAVAQGYSASEYLVDTSGIERVHHAVDTAASIVNNASSENDYNKLYTYKDAICSRVSYNYDAAYDDSTPYGDPWQLISVFDDDTDTNIVCEGYSKAFQYLCDRTAFDGDINCISVSGYMGGGTGAGAHMWNIVTMEDGQHYLVDVTNCDDGTIGAPDQLFLAGYDSGSKDAGYVFNAGGTGISYTYGNDTLNLYDSELEIAGSDYEYHEWSEWIEVTPATCTEGGLEKRTCSLCGEEQTRVTEALGHDYVVAADTADDPTCSEAGHEDDQVCTRCGDTIYGAEIAPLGHELTKVDAKEATETEEGNIEYWVCETCGKYFADSEGTAEISAESVVVPMVVPPAEISWTLVDGVLTVSGEGEMEDFETASNSPWYSQRANITKIVVSEGLTHIGNRAFYQCSNVTEVEIASSVESIGEWAFNGNTSLIEVVIPANVTDLGNSAFRACSSLKKVTFEGYAPSLGTYVFNGASASLTIHCYENTTGWDGEEWSGLNVSIDHKLGEVTIIKEPTCTEEGERQAICMICGETVSEVIPTLGHNYVDGYCTRCEERQIIKNGGCGSDPTGSNVNYVLYGDGELRISGSGDMKSPSNGKPSWYDYRVSIKTIIIDNGVTNIGGYAFYNCSSLTSITIPESVTSIENDAFNGCSSLISVSLPGGVTSIGYGAFSDCGSLTNINIPEGVTSIEYSVFYNCNSLTSITIPESVTSIGDAAFRYCSNLTDITIPESVKNIGEYAFSDCGSLANIVIPESVTIIEDGTFNDCSNLTSVKIPEMVTKIGDFAFDGCSRLTNINIPEYVTSIGESAFSGCSILEIINIHEGVKKIGDRALYNCSSLKSFTIPESVTSIGDEVFYNCSSLKSIACPSPFIGGSYFGYIFGAPSYKENSLYVPESLKEVIIIGDTTSIGENAFYGCSNITSISIPESVTSIGDSAFCNCSSLSDITIPKNITSIGNEVFSGCKSLNKITIPESVTSIGNSAFNGCESLKSVVIPDGVAELKRYAFGNCSNLISIIISSSITTIDYAFTDCDSVKYLEIPFTKESNGNSYLGDIFGRTDSYGTCYNYVPTSLENIIINNEIETIHKNAFAYCTGLKSISLPESLTSIGENAFYGCSNITSITIPNNVTSIGNYAFEDCKGLTSITISDSVKSIGEYAFFGCSSLANIAIPESVTIIEDGTFCRCSSLTSITIPKSVTSIGICAFEGCGSLTSINIPEGITSIGYNLFGGCISLTNITIPESVTSIGYGAFNGCSSLTCIIIPNGVTNIGEYSFYNCNRLTSITIPVSVTDLDKNAISTGTKNIYVVKGSTADSVLKGDSRLKYVTKSGEHYIYESLKKKAKLNSDGTGTNGSIGRKCTVCGKVLSDKIIYYPKTIKLSETSYTYDGKVKKPTVTVKDSKGNTISKTNYTVTYATGRKSVGSYKVTVKFKGNYSGTKTLTFKINPKGTSLKTLTATSKGFKATWTKQATKMSTSYITGYQIQYSTSSKFTTATTKTAMATKYSTVSKTISKLTAKKKYYVRIRTYKTVSGVKYYSPWSASKYVATKA